MKYLLLLIGMLLMCNPLPVSAQKSILSEGAALFVAGDSTKPISPSDSLARLIHRAEPEDVPPFQDSLFLTPYHTIYHFLHFLQAGSFDPAEAAKALASTGLTQEERESYAIQLKKVIDGRGVYIYLDELPRNPEYRDSSKGTTSTTYALSPDLPVIYLQHYGRKWLFSRKTVRETPKLYSQLYPFGVDKLVEALPHLSGKRFLGLQFWQWVLIAGLLLATLTIHKLLSLLFNTVISGFLARFRKVSVANKFIGPVVRPVSLLCILLLLQLFLPTLQLPVKTTQFLVSGFKIAIPLMFVLIAYRVVGFVSYIMGKLAEKTESTLDDQLIPVVRRLMQFLVIFIGGLIVLDNFNYDVTTLLAGLSIGGLAIALAAQDTLKNFFGSLMIFMDRPFQVGQWIIYDKVDGIVEEVGLRSTRVRTFHDSLVYIPNAKLADNVIDNMGLRKYRRFTADLGLQYDTPPHLIEAFVSGVKQLTLAHPLTWKDKNEVHLNGFGPSSLKVLLFIFFDVPDWATELKARHEVMISILYLAQELGVAFAFPTQTLHIETMPGTEGNSLKYGQTAEEAQQKVSAFVKKTEAEWGQ